ncbi:unnamed protein product [Nippostrongylus brasiliensis]|uniref:Uncharacterized protein n=1 Tax=Nippostrongylus brasiliensis TaxID=27835 RepID=A0A0N4YWF2_NIPBR|nr:unnamed protein product [Nippostrongylus brasiliensis]
MASRDSRRRRRRRSRRSPTVGRKRNRWPGSAILVKLILARFSRERLECSSHWVGSC